MPLTRWLAVALATAPLFAPALAAAQVDEQATCDAALPNAELLSRQHKLLEARDKYRTCARAVCGRLMSAGCTKWLAEVDTRMPSLVFSAESGGAPVDASVTSGDVMLTVRLDGRSVDVNPGEHVYTFVSADGRRADVTLVVNEGTKLQRVVATFEPVPVIKEVVPEPRAATAPPEAPSGGNLRTIGYVVGGAGIVGLGIGGVFGLKAIGNKSDANCDAANVCDAGPIASARSAATVSTIGFVAGGVLLAGGLGLVLFGPSGASRKTAPTAVHVVPSVGTSAGGVAVMGAF